MAADPLSLLNRSRQEATGSTPASSQPAPQTAAPAPAMPKPSFDVPKANGPVNFTLPPAPKTPVHGNFFSGNLIQKGMDLLRLPEYAIASFDKGAQNKALELNTKFAQTGKSNRNLAGVIDTAKAGVQNIIPGISARTQFGREPGDYNAGAYVSKNPAVQSGLNFGLSLASPTLPVGKIADKGTQIAGAVAKLPVINKVVGKGLDLSHKIMDVARTNPAIYTSLEKLPGLEHLRNPEAGKIITTAQQAAGSRISGLFNTINDVARGLTPEERVAVGHVIEGGVSTDSKITTRANYIKQISDKIGQELVDTGVMKQETFDKYKGAYLSHIADTVKNQESANLTGSGPLKFFTNSMKQRKNILGATGQPDYIREFQFPVFKALAGEIHSAESAKAVSELAGKFGTTGNKFEKTIAGPRVTADGKVALSDILPANVARQFKGVAVPQEVADYVRRTYSNAPAGLFDRVASKAMSFWKLGKTIYAGPAYHARNLMSNQILSDMSTGAGLPATLAGYGKAVAAYLGKGDAKTAGYLQEMKDAGVINRMGISEGIQSLRPGVFGQTDNKLEKIIKSPIKLQKGMEETSKLNVYSFWRNKGLSIEDAAKKAEEAIFSPYRISQTERGLVKNVIPFYSFTRQALPFTLKTAVNKGSRLTKYDKAKTAVEGLSPEGSSNNANLPPERQGEIRLPIKDAQGNYTYFDPTYILPFGNFGDVGNPLGGGKLPFGLSYNPFLGEAAQQAFNQDSYFNQPIAKSAIPERANTQRVQHAFQSLMPNILPTDLTGIPTGQPDMPLRTRAGNKLYSAFTGQPDYAGRDRNKPQAVLDTFGLKSSVYRPGEQQKWDAVDKNKQLKAIVSEMRSVLNNQSIKSADKQKIIQRLRERQAEIIQQ